MSDKPQDTTTVGADPLRQFVEAVFVRMGMSRAHAETVAEVVVWANLRGVDSHGVTRIPMYVRLLDAGDLNPADRKSTRLNSSHTMTSRMPSSA